MFKKKTCNYCKEKVKHSYNFCPSCGNQLKDVKEDWGLLGKNDKMDTLQEPQFMSGISGSIMNKMLGSALKMLEKELQKEIQSEAIPKRKVKLIINGKEVVPEEKGNSRKENIKILPIEFSKENLKKWTSMKKEEPKTNLKRIGDKIQYEIEIPEVESVNDISIIKLEKGIEIKAIGKEKAYSKTVPIDLPLKKYSLLQGKLTLELDASM